MNTLKTIKVSNLNEFLEHRNKHKSIIAERIRSEKKLINDADEDFFLRGYCHVCDAEREFHIHILSSDNEPGYFVNWRESMVCICSLNNRMRASFHLFESLLEPDVNSKIYMTEQCTPFYQCMSSKYNNVMGSEYLGDKIPYGEKNEHGIYNQSLSKLTFDNEEFDFILSFDVFEHIPDYQSAFAECYRVLKDNGQMLFSVPFSSLSVENIVRAKVNEHDEIEHLMPPEYHGDPMSQDGCLCFYHFGWEMLEQLKSIGFSSAFAVLYWSHELGYLGNGEQIVFVARK